MKKVSNISKLMLVAALSLPIFGQMKAMNDLSVKVVKESAGASYGILRTQPWFWGAVGYFGSKHILSYCKSPKKGWQRALITAGAAVVSYSVARYFCDRAGHEKTQSMVKEVDKKVERVDTKIDDVQVNAEINRRCLEFAIERMKKANNKTQILILQMLKTLLGEKAKDFESRIKDALSDLNDSEDIDAEFARIKQEVLEQVKAEKMADAELNGKNVESDSNSDSNIEDFTVDSEGDTTTTKSLIEVI